MMENTFLTKYSLTSLDDSKTFAINLAKIVKQKDLICLDGTLGVGKTTFARFFIQAMLGQEIDVPSPTFTLLQTYSAKKCDIYHMDLYRLKNAEEVFEVGYEDALAQGITLIEWAENIQEYLPLSRLHLLIEMKNEMERSVTLKPYGTWKERIKNGL